MTKYDVIIIGGGAAGLFCALHAGQRERSVLVLEHNGCVGRKIAVSGGGRCNFTNRYSNPDHFISSNPRFILSPLSRYNPNDFIQLVERHKIAYYEKKLGQLFCQDSAQQIIQMLLDECQRGHVEIRLNCQIRDIQKPELFRVSTSQGDMESDSLVIATGGLSIPKIGASDFGYRIAQQFGLAIAEHQPGLVPLTFGDAERSTWSLLQGVSLEASVRLGKTEFLENVLFTHRGLSGPAILQISSYWQSGETVSINLLPRIDVREFLERNQRESVLLSNLLCAYLPKRFTQVWCEKCAINKPMKQYSPKELGELASRLQNWQLPMQGTEGYSKAEVTLGGVDTRELSSKTMEAKKVSGLFFIGEVVDVTGHLGGHNFQWAWSSGYAAGTAV